MKLDNRTILITGGTSGIGLELARQLLLRGNTVIVTGRSQENLDAAQTALPGLHIFRSDVSYPAAIMELHESLLRRQYGVLCNYGRNCTMMVQYRMQGARCKTN